MKYYLVRVHLQVKNRLECECPQQKNSVGPIDDVYVRTR